MARLPGYQLTVVNGSTTFGLQLAGKKGKLPGEEGYYPEYTDGRTSIFVPQMTTQGLNDASYPLEQNYPVSQKTWHVGFGEETFDTKYPNRYGESVGWDLRDKGIAKLFY